MSEIVVKGMVISSMPIAEYDRRVEILTSEYGRISAFARGSRRPSSNLVSAGRVFAFGQFNLFQGKNSYSISSAKISEFFIELSEDIELMYYGYYFLELAQYFSRENVKAADMLNLLYISLKALVRENFDNRLVRVIYELKMLVINGLCPPAERIASAEGRFTFAAGINESTIYTLNYIISSPINKLYTFKVSEEVLEELEKVVKQLLRMSVDKKFNSLELLEKL